MTVGQKRADSESQREDVGGTWTFPCCMGTARRASRLVPGERLADLDHVSGHQSCSHEVRMSRCRSVGHAVQISTCQTHYMLQAVRQKDSEKLRNYIPRRVAGTGKWITFVSNQINSGSVFEILPPRTRPWVGSLLFNTFHATLFISLTTVFFKIKKKKTVSCGGKPVFESFRHRWHHERDK